MEKFVMSLFKNNRLVFEGPKAPEAPAVAPAPSAEKAPVVPPTRDAVIDHTRDAEARLKAEAPTPADAARIKAEADAKAPAVTPTVAPTPAVAPTGTPTPAPAAAPTVAPTAAPAAAPTPKVEAPTGTPAPTPTAAPAGTPTPTPAPAAGAAPAAPGATPPADAAADAKTEADFKAKHGIMAALIDKVASSDPAKKKALMAAVDSDSIGIGSLLMGALFGIGPAADLVEGFAKDNPGMKGLIGKGKGFMKTLAERFGFGKFFATDLGSKDLAEAAGRVTGGKEFQDDNFKFTEDTVVPPGTTIVVEKQGETHLTVRVPQGASIDAEVGGSKVKLETGDKTTEGGAIRLAAGTPIPKGTEFPAGFSIERTGAPDPAAAAKAPADKPEGEKASA